MLNNIILFCTDDVIYCILIESSVCFGLGIWRRGSDFHYNNMDWVSEVINDVRMQIYTGRVQWDNFIAIIVVDNNFNYQWKQRFSMDNYHCIGTYFYYIYNLSINYSLWYIILEWNLFLVRYRLLPKTKQSLYIIVRI